jgi:uncharacterized LabA/DUF88 family protein
MKTFCFIDSQNLHLGIQSQGWKLDYAKFFVYLKEKYKVDQVFYYVGFLEENVKLYDFLTNCGYEVVFKNTIQYGRNNKFIKGNIDVDLAVDAIRKITQYDKSIFVSADGDFIALYDYLFEEQRKELTIIIPNIYKYSKFLLKYRKNLRFLNDLKFKLGKK